MSPLSLHSSLGAPGKKITTGPLNITPLPKQYDINRIGSMGLVYLHFVDVLMVNVGRYATIHRSGVGKEIYLPNYQPTYFSIKFDAIPAVLVPQVCPKEGYLLTNYLEDGLP